MPNYCENDLAVEGPTEVIEEFLKFAAGESPFDFNRFIPYPEEFRRLDEITEAWDREHAVRSDDDWRARPKDGFNSGGFEWCYANWGTKWPASRVKLEGPVTGYDGKTLEVVFHFDTAWCPPKPVIKKAAELYPALRFELRYYECGVGFHGLVCYSDGEVETDESGAYFGDRGG
jgi:Ferredoxin-like domain in Api92-like protein